MSSTTSLGISLTKTIIGAGMLSIPYAFATDGVLCGVWLILAAAITSGFGLFFQAYVSRYVPRGHASFFSVCLITYPLLLVVFDMAIAVQCFGCSLSYLVLIGDLMPTVVANTTRTFWIGISALVIVPLSFLRNLDSLKFSSVIGLLAIFYLAIVVIGHFLVGDIPREGTVLWVVPPSVTGMFSTFSILVFAYTGHQNMFSIINEASDKSLPALSHLINFAIMLSTVLFVGVGLSGYLTFGDSVNGNVILLYPPGTITTIARAAIVVMVTFLFPLMFHPARISVNNIYYWLTTRSQQTAAPAETEAGETQPLVDDEHAGGPKEAVVVPFPTVPYVVITSLLLAAAYALALSITLFALVLAVVGATGSTAISFILPGLFGYKLIGSELPVETYAILSLRNAALGLSVWGGLVMVVCLGVIIAGNY